MSPREPSPLSGTVVVDASTSTAGNYCGRMLAMNGARVVLVEPPGGSALRNVHPASGDGDSYLFRHLNQGKESVELDLERAPDRDAYAEFVTTADVLIRDQGAGAPAQPPARLVQCVVGQFPEVGRYSTWRATEMIQQALSGVMNATGRIDREPIYGVGERASYTAGTTAYISVVSALWERRRSGLGQLVTATVFESLAGVSQNVVSQFSYNGTAETRDRYPGFLAMLQCADSWITLFAIRNWPTLCRVFDHEEWLTDPRFVTQGDRLANWPLIVDLMQERARSRTADDLVAELQAGRVSAERVTSLAALINGAQWEIRQVLGAVADESGREQAAMSRLYEIAGAHTSVPAPSPALNGDRARVGGRS